MKHIYVKTKTIMLLAYLLIGLSTIGQESLVITTGEIKLNVGDSIQLTAEYTDADSVVQEVLIEWYAIPAELVTIDGSSILKSVQDGKGYLYARYEELIDSVEIEIEAVEDEEEIEEDDDTPAIWGTLDILNEDLELDPGETVQLEAEYTDTAGIVQDVKIKWNTDPGYLAKINKTGMLTAGHSGEGKLYAKYRDLRDSIAIKVNGIPKGDSDGDSIDYPKVKVVPGMVRLAVGDSVELVAFYINENDEKVDTSFSWSVWPEDLGSFPDSTQNKFVAGDETGEGAIIATLGDLADTVKLKIIEPKTWPFKGNNSRRIYIVPGDTVVSAGEAILQYTAEYKTNGKKHEDAKVMWSMSGAPVGTIDSLGLLTLSGETGLALIKAEYSNFSASVELLVIDSLIDSEINTITVHRVLPDGYELPAKTFNEGESYKIGGLPFPLSILNGGMLHFPFGCIDEDIILYMFIPEEYAEVDEDSAEVAFDAEIITGVKFNVKPADSAEIVEPYDFNIPLNLSMVFKHELLDSLGVSPEQLDVFFADNTGFITEGTDYVAIDTVRNKIHAAIAHFSTIVVKPKSAQTFAPDLASSKNRLRIYPNPFRNSTKISFTVESNATISMDIYNIVGQKVTNVANGYYTKGIHSVSWDGTNDSGKSCEPGIYFCRLSKNGKQHVIKKILYNK